MSRDDGFRIEGVQENQHSWVGLPSWALLRKVTHDPRKLSSTGKDRPTRPEDIETAALRERLQRAVDKEKAKNIRPFARYILEVSTGVRNGVLPEIHLWTSEKLLRLKGGLIVPYDVPLIAIDGETQLCGHWLIDDASDLYETEDEAKKLRALHRELRIPVRIHHGVPISEAAAFFYDLNCRAITVAPNLALSMNQGDPTNALCASVEENTPLSGRVERKGRQVAKKGPMVITFAQLRQAVTVLGLGLRGLKYGAKEVPWQKQGIDPSDVEAFALDWFGALFGRFEKEMTDKHGSVLCSGVGYITLGAIGNAIMRKPVSEQAAATKYWIERIAEIDWKRTKKWGGIAGKWNAEKKQLTVSGAKEVAYQVYAAVGESKIERDGKLVENPHFYAVR